GLVAELLDHLSGYVLVRHGGDPILSASFASPLPAHAGGQGGEASRWPKAIAYRRSQGRKNTLLGTKFLGLGDPAIDAARQADLFAHIVGGGRAEARNLPVMEDAHIVELFLNRRRHPGKLLKVVRDPARPGQRLKAKSIGLFRRNLLGERFLSGPD